MKLVKSDQPRRIDRIIDYFGEQGRGEAPGAVLERVTHEGAGPRGDEAA
jgi:hypothetical protein